MGECQPNSVAADVVYVIRQLTVLLLPYVRSTHCLTISRKFPFGNFFKLKLQEYCAVLLFVAYRIITNAVH